MTDNIMQQHPITPPVHLIERWMQDHSTRYALARQAAQWGADQELEACLNCVNKWGSSHNSFADELRVARRPKPPSLKQQALEELDLTADPNGAELSSTQVELIRRALEQLDD